MQPCCTAVTCNDVSYNVISAWPMFILQQQHSGLSLRRLALLRGRRSLASAARRPGRYRRRSTAGPPPSRPCGAAGETVNLAPARTDRLLRRSFAWKIFMLIWRAQRAQRAGKTLPLAPASEHLCEHLFFLKSCYLPFGGSAHVEGRAARPAFRARASRRSPQGAAVSDSPVAPRTLTVPERERHPLTRPASASASGSGL